MSVELQHIFSQIQNELEKLKGDNDSYQYNEHNIDKERHNVLMCNETKDIQAYPGTGKTTLLVDKLSLLLKHWNLKHRGIVVLSHTNVAKNEIIKLSKTYPELGKLLYYPHYIGTIHNFANTFLGLPYAKSNINLEKANNIIIDDEWFYKKFVAYNQSKQLKISNEFKTCYKNNLNHSKYALSFFTGEKQIVKNIDIDSLALGVKPVYNCTKCKDKHSVSIFDNEENLNELINTVYKYGYFSHNSLLGLSLKLIEENNLIISSLRKRFSFVFIDEAQDNSKLQNELLYKLFIEEENPSIVQRFGDNNQTIYSGEYFNNWKFPYQDNTLEIKSSHRCKDKIAQFASSFTSSKTSFKGIKEGGHLCYILFDDKEKEQVLEKFAEKIKILELDKKNNFSAVAIGKDGKQKDRNDKNELQLKIKSYLPSFDKDITKMEYKPKNFLEALNFIKSIVTNEGNVNKAYKILVQCMSREDGYIGQPKEAVLYQIQQYNNLLSQYFGIVSNIENVTEQSICEKLKIEIEQSKDEDSISLQKTSCNTFYKDGVAIRVDTIHSVKGETHNAVLVLETFTRHNTLDNLIKSIFEIKDSKGKNVPLKNSQQNKNILETYFVAFSRATDLLCLAIHCEDFTNDIKNNLNALGFQQITPPRTPPQEP